MLTASVWVAPATAATKTEVAGLSPSAPVLVLGAEATAFDPSNNPPAWYAMAEAYDSGTANAPTRPVYGGYVTHFDFDGYSAPSQIVSANRGLTFAPTGREAHETGTPSAGRKAMPCDTPRPPRRVMHAMCAS
ncbi:hypothetical protein [Allorhizocola rhizosphaerae]|uniref:hypothetical protein n=1 Tax=Allorhizocola rhizosphaerae TaxID=1872709 RepID=UPI000E3E1685|nr:hypothetical protein [Allorhizocola rhizosphaerae]